MSDVAGLLRGVNLNLLVSLDALLEEASVSRAASRLGVTQPAASRSLAELRRLFQDPLLVRSGSKMVLTPRAEAVQAGLRRALSDLAAVIGGEGSFQPAASRRRFRIAAADYSARTVVPALLRRLGDVAPAVAVDIRPFQHERVADLLEQAILDVAIGAEFEDRPGLRSAVLFRDDFVCLVAASSSLAKGRLTVKRYANARHLQVSPRGSGRTFVDRALEERGTARQIAHRVPYFLLAPELVVRSNLLLTLPRRMTTNPVRRGLVVKELPFPSATIEVKLLWHARFEADPANQWLRHEIDRVATGI